MFTLLLHCFLYNFFSTALLSDIANCFKHPNESYNDIESIEISNAIGEYALQRLKGDTGMMSDTQIHLLDWFLHRHYIQNSNFLNALRIRTVTRVNNLSHEASIEFLETAVNYLKTQIAFRNARVSAVGPIATHDQSSGRNAGVSASRPIDIPGRNAGASASRPIDIPGRNAGVYASRPIDIPGRNAGVYASRPIDIPGRNAGVYAARPIGIHDQSSASDWFIVSNAGGSNTDWPIIRPVPRVGGIDFARLLDPDSQSRYLS